MIKKILSFTIFFLFLNNIAFAINKPPQLFFFLGGEESASYKNILEKSCVSGAQIVYSWKQLEPRKGVYDFSKIEKDLNFLGSIHKKLFIQLQDRSFEPTVFNVPDYIRKDPEYHGGVAMQYDFPGEGKPISTGWVARVWDPAVRERYNLLIQQLAEKFDGKIAGINLPETAADFDENNPPQDFTFDKYFYAEVENIKTVRKLFQKSMVIQYLNFFPGEYNNDHHYMSRFFMYAMMHGVGLGGPDVVPYREVQMKNSYPFFHKFQGKILAGMAVQEPDYTYKNPSTGEPYTFFDFYDFARSYLGANILFWNVQEPFFSSQVVPELNCQHFECAETPTS